MLEEAYAGDEAQAPLHHGARRALPPGWLAWPSRRSAVRRRGDGSRRASHATTLTCSPPSSSSAGSWSSQLPVTGASGARSSQKAARSAPAAADAAVVGQCGKRAELAGKLVPRQNLATAGRELLRVELGHGPGASAPVPQP